MEQLFFNIRLTFNTCIFFDFPKSKCDGKCNPISKNRKALRKGSVAVVDTWCYLFMVVHVHPLYTSRFIPVFVKPFTLLNSNLT